MIKQPASDLVDVARSICAAEQLDFIDGIGGGGFKRVFLVRASDGALFALKVLLERNPRTARECEAMVRCNHPHIAQLIRYAAHEFSGRHYDFMLEEYLGGGSLHERIRGSGCLSRAEIINLGKYLIDALAQLHELKLVHRDIKPENIMYRDDRETPVLSDFGIVRNLAATSLTKTVMAQGPCTPFYAPPEQLNNQKELINWRSDQFSLGITLCLSAWGVHPYQYSRDGTDEWDIIDRVATRQPPNRDLIDHMQREGFPCLVKMTSAWPVNRYMRPSELAAAWAAQE